MKVNAGLALALILMVGCGNDRKSNDKSDSAKDDVKLSGSNDAEAGAAIRKVACTARQFLFNGTAEWSKNYTFDMATASKDGKLRNGLLTKEGAEFLADINDVGGAAIALRIELFNDPSSRASVSFGNLTNGRGTDSWEMVTSTDLTKSGTTRLAFVPANQPATNEERSTLLVECSPK